MDEELNYGKIYKPEDDKCCYIAVIIWRMRARAAIRSGMPYQHEPKPIYQGNGLPPANRKLDSVNIGVRQRYSSTVMLAVYQFHRAG
ncbi:hypothetical protein BSR04_00350, partial [Serratia plymuthica]